jgi:hypothetical protein
MRDELKEGIFEKNSFYGLPRLQIFGENFFGRGSVCYPSTSFLKSASFHRD